ncbi:hypothetical protein [Frigoriglobus tundricola]|uniref:DUF3365 domain-containing protein n=1 Tax=Frigoriglobus tundricola TaxID=2774151 RepID=A0A6M5YT74_9BACT|nr:hypothetical protein [Frigoriglobus tundricola]QJW97287.1 hypothetical protein FTUN_4857 [Frigoriglobus tundricola]
MKCPLMSVKLAGVAVALSGLVLAAPAADVPAGEATKHEMEGLTQIHYTAVEVFVGRSGFGFERMPPPPLVSIVKPKSLAEKKPEGKDAEEKLPKREVKHAGLEKLAAPLTRGRFLTADKTEQWVVRELLLIGLDKHPEPVVYLVDPAAEEEGPAKGRDAKTKKKEVKTRKLDAFESESVKVIQGGGELQAERKGKAMRAVAAIYAGEFCLKCHEHEGQMLGAFAYRLERVALKPEERGK